MKNISYEELEDRYATALNREAEKDIELARLREALEERGYPFTLERENARLREEVLIQEGAVAERDRLREELDIAREKAAGRGRVADANLQAELHQAKAEWFEEKKRARETEAELTRLRAIMRDLLDYVDPQERAVEVARRAVEGKS